MPAVRIKSDEQYRKALDVLIEVGGPFQGRGPLEKRFLIVTNAQFDALIRAKVVKETGTKGIDRGQKTRRNGEV